MQVRSGEISLFKNIPRQFGANTAVLEGNRILLKTGKSENTFAFSGKDIETLLRKAVFSVFSFCHKKHLDHISLAVKSLPQGFSAKDTAKVIAQEVFRYFFKYRAPRLKKIILVIKDKKKFTVFNKYVHKYLEYMLYKISQGPFLTVDGIVEYKGGVVLIQRSNPPLGWALPGGFVDYGESVEQAVKREIKEETGLDFLGFKQFKVYSSPDRDPRFHTASVVFVGKGKGRLKGASDAAKAEVFPLKNLPEKMAFDHRRIIEDYKKAKQRKK